jgi:hypothetical protein
MAEILVHASNKGGEGRPVRGMPQDVREDGFQWGRLEGLPRYVVLKLPGVPVETARKYVEPWMGTVAGVEGEGLVRRREWHIDLDNLPAAALRKLTADGSLTIGVGAYAGPRDYTWAQVRAFIRNQRTGKTEA